MLYVLKQKSEERDFLYNFLISSMPNTFNQWEYIISVELRQDNFLPRKNAKVVFIVADLPIK